MKQNISTRSFSSDVLSKIFLTLDTWTYFIQNNKNFSFIKFGDGEFFCMMDKDGENCDKHPYSKELSDKLYDAWYFYNKLDDIYIAEWSGHKPGMNGVTESEQFQMDLISKTKINVKFVNYEILLQNTLSNQKFNFLKSIKNSNRKKIFVGPERLFGIKDFLNVNNLIKVPLINSFSEYDNILSEIYKEISDDSIFMFSCGMPSKSFIHKILEKNKNVTCLDFGSGFDSIFFGNTREGQLPNYYLKQYYEDL